MAIGAGRRDQDRCGGGGLWAGRVQQSAHDIDRCHCHDELKAKAEREAWKREWGSRQLRLKWFR